jgi:hypothetical protein
MRVVLIALVLACPSLQGCSPKEALALMAKIHPYVGKALDAATGKGGKGDKGAKGDKDDKGNGKGQKLASAGEAASSQPGSKNSEHGALGGN